MLLDKNGKLTMRKLKASCLSLELRVESAVVTYDECQGNLLDHPTNSTNSSLFNISFRWVKVFDISLN